MIFFLSNASAQTDLVSTLSSLSHVSVCLSVRLQFGLTGLPYFLDYSCLFVNGMVLRGRQAD